MYRRSWLLTLLVSAHALGRREIWIDPTVEGSLEDAVNKLAATAPLAAAQGRGAATIHLLPGRHRIRQPLYLGPSHSGTRFLGHGKVVISGAIEVGAPGNGGKNVTAWSVVGPANCSGCSEIWRAAIPTGLDSRQFYVNGNRANRTWVAFPAGGVKDPMGSTISAPLPNAVDWTHNVTAIELVYRGAQSAGSQWQESRCPVASIQSGENLKATQTCAADYCEATACPICGANQTNPITSTCRTGPPSGQGLVNKTGHYPNPGGGSVVCPEATPVCLGYVLDHSWGTCTPRSTPTHTTVTVAQPCVYNGNIKVGGAQALHIPAYVENVFELLGSDMGHPGEFFLDSRAGYVYYVPRAGETVKNTVGHVPATEFLVKSTNAANLNFSNITFEHATWLRPSSPWGFVDVQAGWTLACEVGDPCSAGSGEGPNEAFETPAALSFIAATSVFFFNCTFQHLGSNGIGFSHGSHSNRVSGCLFRDISASAVAIGTRDNPINKTTDRQDLANTVSDCTIARVAQEYRGHPGILVGFSHGTTLSHNEISYLPYSGISLGWGWSRYPYTYDGGHVIFGNRIHHHMLVLGDGGAIYTLGAQGNMPFEWPTKYPNKSAILPPSKIANNFIHDAPADAAQDDHDGIGAGCHCPGALYTDEGADPSSTNWNITNNVVSRVHMWLQGCRAGCPWIGPNWQDYNYYDSASQASSNVEARCPLVGDVEVNSSQWPPTALSVMRNAGPQTQS